MASSLRQAINKGRGHAGESSAEAAAGEAHTASRRLVKPEPITRIHKVPLSLQHSVFRAY